MSRSKDDGPPDFKAVLERYNRRWCASCAAWRCRWFPLQSTRASAAGAGANLALACDIVLAAKSANFIQAFSRVGLIPDCSGTWFLPRLVGAARATGPGHPCRAAPD